MSDEAIPDRTKLPLDVLDRIDRACDRFEAAWARGERPRIEDFVNEVDPSYRRALVRDLLAAEIAARRQRGERPEPAEYRKRLTDGDYAINSAFGIVASPPNPRPTDAGHGLLIGLLGYQTGLVDEAKFVEALRLWLTNKSRRVSEILGEMGALDPPRLALLEGLVAEHLRVHGDDVEASLAALPAGQSTRERLASLADPEIDATITQLGRGTRPSSIAFKDSDMFVLGETVTDGQRFRVLRPHAKGGLGAVFVALDAELNREVALKKILDHHADDPTSRARFVMEAEITGRLEHPGIVPVYGLGTYGGGKPYYAMRFVRGDSLKEAVERFHADTKLKADPGLRSLELRKLLRRFLDVCNAIDYAHSRGVLHRDIKPGNVIVGKYGETLVVDWGLAKPMGQSEATSTSDERPLTPSSSSGSAETLPGSADGNTGLHESRTGSGRPRQARSALGRLLARSDALQFADGEGTILGKRRRCA